MLIGLIPIHAPGDVMLVAAATNNLVQLPRGIQTRASWNVD